MNKALALIRPFLPAVRPEPPVRRAVLLAPAGHPVIPEPRPLPKSDIELELEETGCIRMSGRVANWMGQEGTGSVSLGITDHQINALGQSAGGETVSLRLPRAIARHFLPETTVEVYIRIV